MAITNLSTVQFTAEEQKKFSDALAVIKSIVDAKTTNLTDQERQIYGSINEQNKLLIMKINQYATTNPEIIPSYVNKAELDRDYAARNQAEIYLSQMEVTTTNLENIKILLDYDVYQSVQSIYRNVRNMANENVPGMTAIYNDLRQFFPGGRTTKTDSSADKPKTE